MKSLVGYEPRDSHVIGSDGQYLCIWMSREGWKLVSMVRMNQWLISPILVHGEIPWGLEPGLLTFQQDIQVPERLPNIFREDRCGFELPIIHPLSSKAF